MFIVPKNFMTKTMKYIQVAEKYIKKSKNDKSDKERIAKARTHN